jgi:hypothetical protein
MGYLDKSTITVDAILTNRGRELLSQGTGTGNFQITKFAVSDDEVDYGLYNTAHPLGSNYYGAIIENMPVLEATPDETQIMRYKLVSITGDDLTRFGSVVIPQIQIQGTTIPASGTVSIYYNPTAGSTSFTIRPTTTYTSTVSEAESSYTLLLADSSLATVEVRTPATGVVPANNRGSIVANGLEFTITALNKTGSTSVSIFGGTSGAVYNFTLSTTASA